MGFLCMPDKDGNLIEGHPIGVSKIIVGDLREKKVFIDGEENPHIIKNNVGTVLYDRHDPPKRPWFVIVYETGQRETEDEE